MGRADTTENNIIKAEVEVCKATRTRQYYQDMLNNNVGTKTITDYVDKLTILEYRKNELMKDNMDVNNIKLGTKVTDCRRDYKLIRILTKDKLEKVQETGKCIEKRS